MELHNKESVMMFKEVYIPGIVMPKEYDWKKQFEQLAQDYSKNYAPFISLDTGKVLGLALYAYELEQENAELIVALGRKEGNNGTTTNVSNPA